MWRGYSKMDEQEIIREAMGLIGSRRSEKKTAAVRENGKKGGAAAQTEDARKKMRQSQQEWRKRERLAQEALSGDAA